MTYVMPIISTTVSFNPIEGWQIALRGDVDLRAEDSLWSLARSLCRCPGDAVNFDLSGVTSMDAAGWVAVASVAEQLCQAGYSAVVVNPSPAVIQLQDRINFGQESLAARQARHYEPAPWLQT